MFVLYVDPVKDTTADLNVITKVLETIDLIPFVLWVSFPNRNEYRAYKKV